MQLALSEEQIAVQEVFDSFFEKSQTVQLARTTQTPGFDAALWRAMCGMGAAGIAIAEDDGGAGAGLLDAVLVCEQVGRHIAPVPYADSCVAARLLASAGLSQPLTAVLSGSEVATVSLRGSVAGTWPLVPSGAIAQRVIGLHGERLIAVGPAEPPPSLPNLADLPVADWSVQRGAETVIATGQQAAAAFHLALDEWRVLTAAQLVGMAATALQIGVTYVNERTQFGVLLGSFQSIAHHLADCQAAVDGARLLCQEAAWALDQPTSDASTLAAMAFYFAAQTAESVARWSLHFHGGYGFMLEYDIQLFYRRAKALSLLHGDREAILDEVADRLFTQAKVV
jgi:alkylation response protein AidB-like acyl-CoA dehydrogenase